MSACGNLPDQRQHRRVHAVSGEQRGAGIEQPRPGHHRIGLRLAGRERGAERHIGGALFVAGVDHARCLSPARWTARRTDGRCGRRAARRPYRGRARAAPRPWLRRSSSRRSPAAGFLTALGFRHADRECADRAAPVEARLVLTEPCLDKAAMRPLARRSLCLARRSVLREAVARLTALESPRTGDFNASLSLPYLRRAARERHRQDRAAVRLVPPHPRPWRRAVHRPARPLRHHAGGGRSRQPGVQARRDAARGMGGARSTARCAGAPRAPTIPSCRPAQVEVYIDEIEVLGPAGELPMPVFGEQDYPEEIRLKYRFLDLRREQAAPQHHDARRR